MESASADMIGRYEVSGQIAMGGMAELLLGRLCGPSGFERPVVIKRILPHLADSSAFVDMFLDEARIAARIQHPNVVQVYELGREEGNFFIVMEYLQGESLSTIMRRLAAQNRQLPPHLAAHICAQAAAGLHAAHEMKDFDGVSQELVHRDISPQNVFVTYDGAVKVLDFGIATAADRITKTEVGELKGKLAYMSPEQARGESLDRRSDVFALAVVLFELVLGRRLFKRRTQVGTLTAVLDEAIPLLSDIDADAPAALVSVCSKGLTRQRDKRYASAAALRRDLVAFTSKAAPGELLEERLADLMGALFADRIDEKSELLRDLRAGNEVTDVPQGELDIDVELPSILVDPSHLRGRRKRHLMSALVLVSTAALGVGVALSQRDAEAPAARSAQAPSLEPSASAMEEPSHVDVDTRSRPSGATIFVGGAEVGTTPSVISLARSDEPIELRLEAEGYEVFYEEVTPNVQSRVVATLQPVAQAEAEPAPSEPPPTPMRRRRPEPTPMSAAVEAPPPAMQPVMRREPTNVHGAPIADDVPF